MSQMSQQSEAEGARDRPAQPLDCAHAAAQSPPNTSSKKVDGSAPLDPARFVTRRLELGDREKGFLALLGQLTVGGEVSAEQFKARFEERARCGDLYNTFVIEDLQLRKIIASATLLLERKFTRGLGLVGHVEDVVVSSDYRGLNLGIRVMQALIDLAWRAGCYKIILDCADKNVPFYEKLGFAVKERQMALYAASQ